MNNFKLKPITFLLIIVILIVSCVSVYGQNSLFNDVTERHWAYESISKINGMGHMIGKGTPNGVVFDPNGEITGLEMYMTLWRIANTPEPVTENKPFVELNSDVKNQWYTDPYEWAMYSGIANVTWRLGDSGDVPDGGIVTGRIGSAIQPADELKYVMSNESFARNYATRTDVILSLYYYVTTYLDMDVSVGADMSMFSDWDIANIEGEDDEPSTKLEYGSILWTYSDEMIPAWKWAVSSGIIKGCSDGTLQMGEYDRANQTRRYVTRAEYATILNRFIEYLDTLKI